MSFEITGVSVTGIAHDEKRIVSCREIGKRIKSRRHELSLTQEELATMLDVSYQQVQRYESGKDRLNVEKLQAVAHALSAPVSYFISADGCESPLVADRRESELIGHFRKVNHAGIKSLMLNMANMLARWEEEWDGR